ncbi:hypothetical protein WELLINGTON_197 [Erwinia phage Wellington]|uniref:Uncharacterized protein n=1 Tax=Erwinia phage Wellington TaxID=2267653 RepID=A0A345BLK4_9CAUD|nr:hypothetical protein HOT70_gp104 [Erwinia phage Wellington]AXF51325.1 hypothetical protein WELLINGTON_197 [Erwinia phage Wellington]
MAFGSVCLLRIRHPEYYRMNNQQKFQTIVERELANLKGKFQKSSELAVALHEAVVAAAKKETDLSVIRLSIHSPDLKNNVTDINADLRLCLSLANGEELTAYIATEAWLNALPLEWSFQGILPGQVTTTIGTLLVNIDGANSLEEAALVVAQTAAKEFPGYVIYHTMDRDGMWVVYFLERKTTKVAIVGSWALADFFPRLATQSTQSAIKVTVDSILNMLTPPQELQGLGGIQRSPENLFIAVKTYLRNLRDYYRVAFPFTYQVLWATSTDNLAKPVLELIGSAELSLVAETDAIISIIERRIGDDAELREKFMAHVRNPMHIATHIMVRITVDVGVTKTWFSPIAGMVRASGSYDVNTNNPHLPLWVVASFREVMTPPPRPRNTRNALEDHVHDSVERLGQEFGKGSVFVPCLKANIATLWGSVVENHAKPQLGFQAPYRMVRTIVADFAQWLDHHGKDLMMSDDDFSMHVVPAQFAIEVVFTDHRTGRTETVLFTYADLDGQIKAGLDWHPEAPTFFIPREF